MVYPVLWSPIDNLPGPLTSSFWESNLHQLFDSRRSWAAHEKLAQVYGRTLRVFGLAKFDQRVLSMDPSVISHVLHRPSIYQKPWQTRAFISAIIGESLLSSEGGKHRRQRRVADQAFSERNLQSFLPIMFSRAAELTERWVAIADKSDEGKATIDVVNWIQRTTLDVIGEVGFGVNLNALNDEHNELHLTYKEMFGVLLKRQHPLITLIGISLPRLQPWIPTDMFTTLTRCKSAVHEFGSKLIEEKRQLLSGQEKCKARDFLTLFLKANSQPDLSEDQRMSDQELLDIVNTMLSAGSDTTALSIVWALHYLSINPAVQARLKEELANIPVYNASQICSEEEIIAHFNAIDRLPYLDAVMKETIRLAPSIHSTIRVAMTDDEIPLSEEMIMRDGSIEKTFKVKKGQWIHLPLEATSIDRTIWGEDAWEFKPERWDSLPEKVADLRGPYANMLSFSAGPRVCIGMRFAQMEWKIDLHHIISCLTFGPTAKIVKGTVSFSRPYVEEDWRKGRPSSLPLSVSRDLPEEAVCT